MRDTEIIRLYFMRDERAITATDKAYGGAVMQMSIQNLKDRADAEENKYDTWLPGTRFLRNARFISFHGCLRFAAARHLTGWTGGKPGNGIFRLYA